ncbi:hypothetical protein [Paenibacillus sp. DMB5]|uniref:hypothetical protein n=1 Tax=Paenibacillus sp. DMB5 TaxID=1780103 RepID=UPI00076D20A2|nr:hypothetical protein [Paenibacillus sp. DMB5]KUP23760.1 hypothetical protein AWJ19_09955 [Paenibacillus sp. DMB5]
MTILDYTPVWPETAVFWGAGATASIGMRTTQKLSESFYLLAQKDVTLTDRVKKSIGYDDKPVWLEAVVDLLNILGDPDTSTEAIESIRRQFPLLNEDQQRTRLEELRSTYDWNTLYRIIQICPGNTKEEFQLQDLFNILDMHILNRQGFYVPDEVDASFIPFNRMIGARNSLKMLTILMHTLDFQFAITEKRDLIKKYESFAEVLYQLMIEEGFDFYKDVPDKLQERSFYLFSHSIISMNWDPILLWLLFNVHNNHNNGASPPVIGVPPMPLKLFHDMGHFMGVRKIDGNTPQVWYPFNETVVQRMNDPDHITSRRVRVGKYYFPHGCSGWRECPNCGKLTMYMGGEWGLDTATLFPPLPLPSLSFGYEVKSLQEKNAQDNGRSDAIQCTFCGTITEAQHVPLVMQSNFKGEHPSFVEEIQRDMRVSLERTQHVVLMGYSLPSDDVIYRSLLSARKNRGKGIFCSAVGKSAIPTDGWIGKDQIDSFLDKLRKDAPQDPFIRTITSVIEIFGKENARFCGDGIPGVFLENTGGSASMHKVKELLYPSPIFPGYRVLRV